MRNAHMPPYDTLRHDDRALRLLADTVVSLLWIARTDGFVEYWNEPMRSFLGIEAGLPTFDWSDIIHSDDMTQLQERVSNPANGVVTMDLRLRRNDGTYRWFHARMSVLAESDTGSSRWFGSASDIDDRKRADDAIAYLEDATNALATIRDVGSALRSAVELAVPRMADWCAMYLRKPDGIFYPAAIHHRDPNMVRFAHELVRRYPFSDETSMAVLERREPIYMPFITPEQLRAGAKSEQHADMLLQLDLASAIVVPLLASDGVIGMLHLVRGATSERFVAFDVSLAQLVARRVAIAIDNAKVFERDHAIAATFQRVALPRTLPSLPLVELDAIYVAGESEARVGGDWYDAFPLVDGTLVISIGDVAGKGLEAAVHMSSVRQAIRVAALQGLAPDAILHVAQAALVAEHPARFVTAFVAAISADRTVVAYASAGHPAPLLRWDDTVHELQLGGPPLGVADLPFTTHHEILAERCMLLAYTDGLIETTANIIEGQQRLAELVASSGMERAARPATFLRERLLGDAVHDDTAILAVRIDRRAVPPRFRFQADDVTVAPHARQKLTAWMNAHVKGDLASAELIAGELIGNVVRHAPGPINISIAFEDDRVRLCVQDSGAGFAERAPASDDELSERGRGLAIIEALATNVKVELLPAFGKQISVDLPVFL